MAKKSKIVANERRRATVAKYAEKRRELKEKARTAKTVAEAMEFHRQLSLLPRDASPTRVRNRDQIDGRPRGYIGKAGLSRVRFRELALRGELPGIKKSSW